MKANQQKDKPLQAFMSHKSCDRVFATKLATDLRKNGIKTWLDDWSMPPGKPLTDAMERGINESDVMLIVLTKEAVSAISSGKGGLAFEVHIGEDRCFTDSHFRIIGLEKETCNPPAKLRNRIGRWLDFRDNSLYDERLSELVFWIKNPDGDRGPEVQSDSIPEPDVVPILEPLNLALDAAMIAFELEQISSACSGILDVQNMHNAYDSRPMFECHRWERFEYYRRYLVDAIRNLLVDFEHPEDMSLKLTIHRLEDFLSSHYPNSRDSIPAKQRLLVAQQPAKRFVVSIPKVLSIFDRQIEEKEIKKILDTNILNVIFELKRDVDVNRQNLIYGVSKARAEVRYQLKSQQNNKPDG